MSTLSHIMINELTGRATDGDSVRPVEQLYTDVRERFGVLPNFFRLAPESPEIAANLWDFARFAYLDNPLNALFKERLFVYLSRFCESRYCIVRHLGFLTGLGRPSGDRHYDGQTVEEVLPLLRRSLPRGERAERDIARCAELIAPLTELPMPDSEMEQALFTCAAHTFLQTAEAPRCQAALKDALGEVRLQHLILFLSFIQTAHYWTKTHPELAFEDDVKHLLATNEALAEYLLNDPEAGGGHIGQRFHDQLDTTLREGKRHEDELSQALRVQSARGEALRETEARFHEMIDALPPAIYTTDAEGRLTYFNPAAIEFSGRMPKFGSDQWCVTWKLYYPDGTPMPHDQCPMAIALKEDRPVRGAEAIAERPDGRRVWFEPYPTPLHDREGRVVGGVNMILDITERKQAEFLLKSEKRALEMAAGGAPLREVVEFLIGMVEAQSGGRLVASLALLNENQTHFIDSIAPKLPASYHQAVEGMAVVSDTGSCCRAVLTGRPVIIPDVAADPQWSRFAAFLLPLGYRAAWSTPVRGSDGKVLGTFAIYYTQHPQEPKRSDQQFVEGITQTVALVIEHAHADRLLRENEERFRMLADNMAQLAWTCDTLGNVTWYNQRWLDYTGLSFEEIKGWNWLKVQHPDHLERVVERVKRSAETGEPWEDTFPVLGRDGQYRWFLSRAIPIRNEQGEIVRWFGTNTDVTERRAAEERLRESRREYEALVWASAQIVWETDAEGTVTKDSPTWREYTGQTFDEQRGLGWADAVHADDRQRIQAEWRRHVEAKKPIEIECRLRHKNGEWRWTMVRATPLRKPDGTIEKWVAMNTDIHERKIAEEGRERLLAAEREARKAADAASRAKDEFMATLSHELRTPLNAMLGWARLLACGKTDEEITARGLKSIEQNAKAQAQLIEDLLDVSRIIFRKFRFKNEPVKMAPVIEAAVDSIRPTAETKGIRLQVRLEPDVGLVLGDAERLQQVVWNLLSNAVKFTPRGGRVQVGLSGMNSHIEIMVSDTGKGIAPEFLQHVFNRFSQADGSSTRTNAGLGLGLAIVRHIVELHGGSIFVDSPGKGQGATFIVRLPLMAIHTRYIDEERAHPRVSGEMVRGFSPSLILEGFKVLVVDDEPDTLLLLSTVLTKSGAYVKTASSAEEGIREIQTSRPDVIVSDIAMPSEDGFDFIRKVQSWARTTGTGIPAVALTGYTRDEDRMKALSAGFQVHLPKPVEPAELIAVIVSLVAGPTTPCKTVS